MILVLGRLAVLKISSILLKYPTFEGVYFIFSWKNKYKIRVSVLYTKKWIIIIARKLQILALKCTFLGQNRLKTDFELWVVLIEIVHRVTYI